MRRIAPAGPVGLRARLRRVRGERAAPAAADRDLGPARGRVGRADDRARPLDAGRRSGDRRPAAGGRDPATCRREGCRRRCRMDDDARACVRRSPTPRPRGRHAVHVDFDRDRRSTGSARALRARGVRAGIEGRRSRRRRRRASVARLRKVFPVGPTRSSRLRWSAPGRSARSRAGPSRALDDRGRARGGAGRASCGHALAGLRLDGTQGDGRRGRRSLGLLARDGVGALDRRARRWGTVVGDRSLRVRGDRLDRPMGRARVPDVLDRAPPEGRHGRDGADRRMPRRGLPLDARRRGK
jgi:hypothetical protein